MSGYKFSLVGIFKQRDSGESDKWCYKRMSSNADGCLIWLWSWSFKFRRARLLHKSDHEFNRNYDMYLLKYSQQSSLYGLYLVCMD